MTNVQITPISLLSNLEPYISETHTQNFWRLKDTRSVIKKLPSFTGVILLSQERAETLTAHKTLHTIYASEHIY